MKSNIHYAFRNILKNKLNSIISIVGFTVASTCLLLIYLYLTQEFHYNNFHVEGNKIFKLNYTLTFENGIKEDDALLDYQLSKIIKEKIPQVDKCTAFRGSHGPTIIFQNHNLEENIYLTEPDFFKIFTFKLLLGNRDRLFQNPNEIVITQSLANKFQAIHSCRIDSLIGLQVQFPKIENQSFVISGIMEDPPKNSSIQFSGLIPYKYANDKLPWSNTFFGKSSVFYKIDRTENAKIAEELVSKTVVDFYQEAIKLYQSKKYLAETSDCFVPFSLPLKKIYLNDKKNDYEKTNNKNSLYILSVVGFFILFVACSNFIMLTLGQTLRNVSKISIRMTLGAKPKHIFAQFFFENIILTLIAFVLGLLLTYELLPVMKILTKNEVYLELINIPGFLLFLVTTILLITLITSLIQVVKLQKKYKQQIISKGDTQNKKIGPFQSFVMLQYTLSIILIALSIGIIKQTQFMKNKKLGFSSNNVINLRVYHLSEKEKRTLSDYISAYPGITSHSFSDRNYVSGRSMGYVQNSNDENVEARLLYVDHNYISTLNLKIIQGENFKPELPNFESVIVNQKLASFINPEGEIVNETISIDGQQRRIIGVINDFHFDSTKETIKPLALILRADFGKRSKFAFLKYKTDKKAETIQFIKNTWDKVAPNKELDYKFWNEQLNARYQNEERWSLIITYSAIIAIIISSLGLFGLTILIINKRIKEIGIRKVNGAKTKEILSMLNGEFIKWVAFAFVIACPITYYILNKWLNNFAYKTNISWWIFVLAGIITVGIALLTVSWQSWRAAKRNPVESLRYE
ncbi:FtsX-like permease family protein [Marinifilum fragile]|uniref:ABC transporter permease n=1 Tax=Marinifilum fragile TaxID=570161 RepID=UPI002AA7287D|nr:FtsX-like permease family protein [Marinifilum fragile]